MSEPVLYRLIRERHGEAAATALCQRYGGRKLTIPLQATPVHKIARLVGVAVLQTLVDELGGEIIHVPLGPTGEASRRQAALEAAVAAGLPTGEITSTLRVSRNAVMKARRRLQRRGLLSA